MSGAKHTPGPWAVALRKGQIATQGPATEWLATMPHSASGGFGLTDVREIAANARLIAAAPDLLAACQEFVRKVECGEAKSTRSYEQMKAAISRATGEA